MNIVDILERYPDARMLYKQMDKNNDSRNRLERLRMRAEGNTLSDQMLNLLERLQKTVQIENEKE